MLVVAADEGFMPQTVEHLDILTLLGIRDGVVVITKTDMVDEEWVEIVREDIAAHVKGTFLEGKPVLPVSAYTGSGHPGTEKGASAAGEPGGRPATSRSPSACRWIGCSPRTASAPWSPAP